MRRGEVRWHRFKEPDKQRPVVVLTRDEAIPKLQDVTIAPITSTVRHVPSEVVLDEGDGLSKTCAVNLYYLRTVSKGDLSGPIARLGVERMQEIAVALKFTLALDE